MSASLVSVEEKKDAFGKPSRDRGSCLPRRACEGGASHPRQERSFDRVSQARRERGERAPPIRAGLAPTTPEKLPASLTVEREGRRNSNVGPPGRRGALEEFGGNDEGERHYLGFGDPGLQEAQMPLRVLQILPIARALQRSCGR